jgi:hypothetical protein
VIGPERVFESGVSGAWVDQVGEAELADISEALHGIRVEQFEGEGLDTDVIPERVSDYFD